MSVHSIKRTHRVLYLDTAMPWIAAAAIGLLLVALAPRLLADPDTYSHIALGRWMVAHLSVPSIDPLSQTMRGTPWIAFEWLSQVFLAQIYALCGWAGVVALTALAASLTFGLLAQALAREWQPRGVIGGVLVAVMLVSPHLLARPHVLAMPILVAWIASLVRSNDEKRQPSLWLLPLMTLWANLHASYSFGLAMLVPLAFEAVYGAQPDERGRVLQRWCVFALLALVAAGINPYGPAMTLATFRTIALGHALNMITEWRPQDFTHPGPYELILLAAFAGALYCGAKLPPVRLVILLGLVHLSLSQVRHADLLGLLGPLLVARPLAMQFRELAARPAHDLKIGFSPTPAIAAIVIIAAAALRPDVAPARAITPGAAMRAIGSEAGPILNDYAFGGYLDFIGAAPFIDGRGELYGEQYLLRYQQALDLQNIAEFERLLDQYHIRTTLLTPSTPAVSLLDRLPGWRRIYADNIAVVHQREPTANPGLPRR